MKTSDHFIEVPAASLPGTSVFAVPGAGFQILVGESVSKSNPLSRPSLICLSCHKKSARTGAGERPEPSRLTLSGARGAVHCEVGCTQFWKTKNWGLLLIFLGMVLNRRASARHFVGSSPLKGTEGDRQPALSRCEIAGAVPV